MADWLTVIVFCMWSGTSVEGPRRETDCAAAWIGHTSDTEAIIPSLGQVTLF